MFKPHYLWYFFIAARTDKDRLFRGSAEDTSDLRDMEETLGLGARLSFPGRRVSESQDRCESELGKAMSTSSSPCAVRWDTILCVQQDSGLTGLLLGVLPSDNPVL